MRDLMAAKLFDRYRIVREIGRGGTAVVYLAEDLKHDRPVALKVLLPELALNVRNEPFLREIQIAARLTHPHILPLYDSGEAEDTLYYVMPYLEGESLRDRLTRERQLPLAEALRICRDVASALGYAHAHGFLHRDIKPENILLQDGTAVVADFGIARALSEASGSGPTHSGLVVGTPAYMSPEQAAGNLELDGRSDVYALGCVLYETLAGHPPFTGSSPQEILTRHALDSLPRLAAARSDVPEGVEAAIRKALAKTPGDRFATAGDFAAALGTQHAIAVLPVTQGAAVGAPQRTPTFETSSAPRNPRAMRRFLQLTIVVIALLGFGALVARGSLRPNASLRSAREARSIVVIPFVNVSPDSANEYFSDGLTEELISALTRVKGMRVAARSASFHFKKSNVSLRAIGDSLNVASALEGSVRKVGTRVRIAARLVNVEDGYHLWSETYDRELRDAADVIAIQDGIARSIADKLELGIGPDPREHQTNKLDAYDLYLRGRYYFNRRGPANLRKAVEYFSRAVASDSGYALAYSGLADAHLLLGEGARGSAETPAEYGRAKAAALKAIALDESAAETHCSLARVFQNAEWDWPGAEREFRLCVELNPDYALGHQWYGLFLARIYGRFDEAIREGERAVELDPFSAARLNSLGNIFNMSRQYDQAAKVYRRAIALEPDFMFPHRSLATALAFSGNLREAFVENQRAFELAASAVERIHITADRAIMLALSGNRAAATRILEELKSQPDTPPFHLARVYAGLDDHDNALRILEQSVNNRDLTMITLRLDFAVLESNPRFKRLLALYESGARPARLKE